ncbi:MAG: hypothetical protein PVJ49_10760 [Acidobacteriota bacterium]|jgi:hypothetical protein
MRKSVRQTERCTVTSTSPAVEVRRGFFFFFFTVDNRRVLT